MKKKRDRRAVVIPLSFDMETFPSGTVFFKCSSSTCRNTVGVCHGGGKYTPICCGRKMVRL
jgi:hypothetical protein